jgi:hypothetical protein
MNDFNKAAEILRNTKTLTLKDLGGSKAGDGFLFAMRSGCPPALLPMNGDREAHTGTNGSKKSR